jgi:putative chitinase
MSIITAAQLQRISPVAVPHVIAAIADHADRVLPKYGLDTLRRVQQFLAQIAEETGGFRLLFENLNYSAAQLMRTWPSRFHSLAAAEAVAHNPAAIANTVYGGRMGNLVWGEGWKYRGQGLLQETGHSMFALLQHLTGLPLVEHPELAAADEHMLECAAASFSHIPGVLHACDHADIAGVTKLVNGGLINLATRQLYLAHCEHVIRVLGPVDPLARRAA